MYLSGEGVTRDTQAAIKYFQFAAEKGNIPAQKIISREYIAGVSLPRDYNKAKYWMELAAGKGDAEAQFLLGRYYNSGLGFDDKNESFRWFSAAANQGSAKRNMWLVSTTSVVSVRKGIRGLPINGFRAL